MEVVAAQTSKDIRRRAQRQLRQAGHFVMYISTLRGQKLTKSFQE